MTDRPPKKVTKKPLKEPPPPAAPAVNGVKVRKLGTTWWGQRWMRALERTSRDYLNRLGRGRSYARTGRVRKLVVKPGCVTARISGSEPEPYEVALRLDVLDASDWDDAIARMATEARFAAELLAGRMPHEIDSVFHSRKRSLFPLNNHELETDCSCADWANPCKHVAATHYVLAEALDKDPFLLFELRGRTKDEVLEALCRLRSGSAATAPAAQSPAPATAGSANGASVAVSGLDAADYERAQLPHLHFSFDPPTVPASILRSLGAPASWSQSQSPVEFFADCYTQVSQRALEIALGTEGEPAAPADAPRPRGKRKA